MIDMAPSPGWLPSFFYNSWNPVFDGSFVAEGGTRTLVGHFQVNWFVFAFILFFVGSILYDVWMTYQAPTSRPGYVSNWRETHLRWEISFLGMAVGINVIGWLIGIPYQRRILAAIRESTAP
jgi:hypothetical protein